MKDTLSFQEESRSVMDILLNQSLVQIGTLRHSKQQRADDRWTLYRALQISPNDHLESRREGG